MVKGIYIGFRLSDDEVRRLKTLQGSKTVSDCIRNLINERFTESKKELQGIEELLKKLDNSDMVKISKDIKKILTHTAWISVLTNNMAKSVMDKEEYIKFRTATGAKLNKLKQQKEDK